MSKHTTETVKESGGIRPEQGDGRCWPEGWAEGFGDLIRRYIPTIGLVGALALSACGGDTIGKIGDALDEALKWRDEVVNVVEAVAVQHVITAEEAGQFAEGDKVLDKTWTDRVKHLPDVVVDFVRDKCIVGHVTGPDAAAMGVDEASPVWSAKCSRLIRLG